MQIKEIEISKLKDYPNNPRHNEKAVDAVANSIKEFGFKNPIIIDKDFVIVAGHTRRLAAEKLGLKVVPCIVADDLTPEQIKAFRLIDNKTAELAEWNFDKLEEELASLTDFDMSDFGFEHLEDIDWAGVEDLSESSYEEPKKTYLKCPHCGHIDTTTHFIKVNKDESEEEEGDE